MPMHREARPWDARMAERAGGVEPLTFRSEQESFVWNIPEKFNIGADVCDRWADIDPERTAIIEYDSGRLRRTSFGDLRDLSNRIAHHLRALGIERGDRIGILAPQRLETAAAHIAVYKIGAIAVPLFTLFGEDALRHRLGDSGAKAVFADMDGLRKVEGIKGTLPALEHVIPFDAEGGEPPLVERVAGLDRLFQPVDTRADDAALIIYTSGTTGSSKGALHGHRVLLGHLPGVEMSHDGFPEPGDCIWTPADWAWIGGLLDVLLPALHHGVPVVAHRFAKFDVKAAYALIADCGVRNMFLPPTALKMMRAAEPPDVPLSIRSIGSGGEALGQELLNWGRSVLGVTINEFYGQTECNMTVSSSGALFATPPGAIGKAVPGHAVAIVDAEGKLLKPGEQGEIAVRAPDPVMFLGYWNLPEATAGKYAGPWLLTGDLGWMDEEGFIYYLGRADDVITSAGYRIGPAEIEDCILRHPAVQSVGVAGVPDSDRTEVVGAFIVTRPGHAQDDALVAEIQQLVRSRLGGHQYPRLVRFVEALPTTATGKIIRRALRDLV